MFTSDSVIYYLPKRVLGIIENIMQVPNRPWRWYIHLADIFYDPDYQAWLMKDLFLDLLVARDGRQQRLIDCDDLALALEVGLVTPAKTSEILRRAEQLMDEVGRGEFPFAEMELGRKIALELGWQIAA